MVKVQIKDEPTVDEPKSEVSNVSKEIIDQLKDEIFQSFFRGSKRNELCDFTVVVDNKEFSCHRFVLDACSGFFEALFRSDMKESRELKATIRGMSSNTFGLILDVIYGRCEALVPDKMIDIWKGAHQLQIQCLVSACESYLMHNNNADNSYIIYTHAQVLQSPQVSRSALNYMVEHFYAFVHSDHFGEIKYEDFLQIVENKNLQACADFKVEAILKWCKAGSKNNEIKTPKTAQSCTKIPLMSNLIKAADLTMVSKDCLASLLTNAFVQGNIYFNMAVNSQAARILVDGESDFAPKLNNSINMCQHCINNHSWTDPSDNSDSLDTVYWDTSDSSDSLHS